MKEKFKDLLLVFMCILLVVCLFQIADLRGEVRNKYNYISNNISHISNEISGISSRVAYQLEQEASIIAQQSYELGEADMESLTVMLNASVTPKEYSDSRTTAKLYVGESVFDMDKADGTFVISEPISIFNQISIAKVEFREGDTVRTEELNWWISPRDEAIIRTYAQYDGGWSSTGDAEEKICTWAPNGGLSVDVETNGNGSVTEAELYYLIDGKEIKKETMTITGDANKGYFNNYHEIAEPVEIPYGSTFQMHTVITDNLGLKHFNIVERITVNDTGTIVNDEQDWIWRHSEDMIFDAEGNLLYDPYDINGYEIDYVI